MTIRIAAAIAVLTGLPVSAHRLDEYLQGTIISVEKGRLEAEVTLTPGVIVFPLLIAEIDTDSSGSISEAEQRAYAGRVLKDLSLAIDGHRLTPQLVTMRFPAVDEMREGRGEIQLDFIASLPPGGRNRKLVLENRHQRRIAAYQVNCLVSRDPHIRIMAQNRNYTQSLYELDFEETDVRDELFSAGVWLSSIALLLLARFTFLYRQRFGKRRSSDPKVCNGTLLALSSHRLNPNNAPRVH